MTGGVCVVMKSRHGSDAVNLVVVGSIGLDTIKTPAATRRDILGGSVSYACAAASFFALFRARRLLYTRNVCFPGSRRHGFWG